MIQPSRGHSPPPRSLSDFGFPSAAGRRIAETVRLAIEHQGFRFDGSDLTPPEIGLGAFLDGMVRYFKEGHQSLEGIMADVEAAWVDLESES